MARARVFYHSRTLAAAAVATSAAALYTRQTAWAESPADDDIPQRKPIYSSPSPIHIPKQPTLPIPSSETTHNSPPSGPTPTDRLAAQISHLRLSLYHASLTTETALNNLLTYTFRKETDLANTISSLAPSPATGEKLLPGAIYVLVSTLAGSIVTRNRNILLRATVPLGVGVAAGWALIPVTMRNVGNLVWEYEKEVPVLAESHLAVRKLGEEAWRRVVREGKGVVEKVEGAGEEGRRMVEGWVEKGK